MIRGPDRRFPVPWALALLGGILVLCFSVPLYRWGQFALRAHEGLFAYVFLVPCVSAYLIFAQRRQLFDESAPARWVGWGIIGGGWLLLAAYLVAGRRTTSVVEDDLLALVTGSLVLFFAGGCGLLLGRKAYRAVAFPLAFLLLMLPFPVALRDAVESFLQHWSAVTAELFFRLSGMPVMRDAMYLQLPGIHMVVAQECSGIRSSVVLFITSLLAGYLFLSTPWKRAILVGVVLPLGILRNAFRIFTIGQLCVRIGPEMFDSPLHRRGGPLFFALSLVPLLLLLWYFAKSDARRKTKSPVQGASHA
jgi:exosortase C (VPDSG-CTERM-specific)